MPAPQPRRMIPRTRADRACQALSSLADQDLISLPEGRLALHVLFQAVRDWLECPISAHDYEYSEPVDVNAQRFIASPAWVTWCALIRLDPDTSRAAIERYRTFSEAT